MTCSNLAKYAFDTHVECYVNPGYVSKGLCSIWLSQNIVGLTSTLEIKDFFKSPDAIKQVITLLLIYFLYFNCQNFIRD